MWTFYMSERGPELQAGDARSACFAFTVALWRDSTDTPGLRAGMSLLLSRSKHIGCVFKDGKERGEPRRWEGAGPRVGCSTCVIWAHRLLSQRKCSGSGPREGSVSRPCSATHSYLTLVKPVVLLGFNPSNYKRENPQME